ncbi:helix-turn-helix domain-containing protein [Rhizobium miluonense]|uniref:Regulatory protein, Fis family n=1 Tax=Rhizobium miluonense TaxID=411945 RepID=A0A1C3X5L6_9HYPH|nr:helix-turn-helix domain-containing protein [Rhizobium miluonense]SCB47521.1 regulatory protein, Fis family [Rhizobium miluonense]
MRQPLFASDYRASAAQATRELKVKTLLRALVRRLHDALSTGDNALSAAFSGGEAPQILIRDASAELVGRITIDAESDLYVFCELGDGATDIVIATASEDRLLEELVLHLREGHPVGQAVDAAIDMLVGQTIEDVERKLILQTLRHCKGDPTHTAFMLGMPLATLCNKLSAYFAESASELPQAGVVAGFAMGAYRL